MRETNHDASSRTTCHHFLFFSPQFLIFFFRIPWFFVVQQQHVHREVTRDHARSIFSLLKLTETGPKPERSQLQSGGGGKQMSRVQVKSRFFFFFKSPFKRVYASYKCIASNMDIIFSVTNGQDCHTRKKKYGPQEEIRASGRKIRAFPQAVFFVYDVRCIKTPGAASTRVSVATKRVLQRSTAERLLDILVMPLM